ncbi:ubiquitin recognition factor in ER-associated degradation protein 1-like [Triticum urartu]|uniref:ubiquitin recognition factor in ER-associated degradation protein 1-like n=1 Tax=Triticum urartu TaxID=4572 RepID=UPI002043D8DA|nr:ubiquitin recognition factor in ER-associated degradation protein 1-like [Triticum urartu]
MVRLGLEEDDLVLMTSTSLPKATSVKLRPHTMDFLGAKDLKRLLEFNVRLNTPCVTVGDTIAVAEGGRRYLLDVVEAKPADAVSTLDTDCEVDFATPLDYVQPPAPVPVKVAAAPCQDCAHGGERRFVGVGMRMDGKPVETPPPAPAPEAGSSIKGKNASEHVLRFFGRRGSVVVPPPGAKSKKKVDGDEDKEAKWFTGHKYTL